MDSRPRFASLRCRTCSKRGQAIVIDWWRAGQRLQSGPGAPLLAEEAPGGPAVWTCQAGCEPKRTVLSPSRLEDALDRVVATTKARRAAHLRRQVADLLTSDSVSDQQSEQGAE